MSYKWTVLFLVHASDGYTRKYAEELFKILEATHQNKGVKVLVLYGALQASYSTGYKIQVILKELSNQSLTEVKTYGVIDMGDDRKLGPIFSEIRRDYPSDRFLLFTWDHGSGFGIFKTNPRENVITTKRGIDFQSDRFNMQGKELNAADIMIGLHVDSKNTQATRSITFSENDYQLKIIFSKPVKEAHTRKLGEIEREVGEKIKTSMLTNDELRNIIKLNLKDGKVDLLIMMNCMMQMIETGYALHDVVEYLVAPETCIFWAGYDYIEIINRLCTNPEIETEAIARHAIDTIENYYQHTPFKKDFNDLVISLVKPGESPEVKKAIDKIASELCDDLKATENDIKDTRGSCKDLSEKYVEGTPYHYVDFANYIFSLSRKLEEEDIDINKLKKIIDKYVIHILKGNNYRKSHDKGIGEINGFTIYFPPTANEAYNDFYYEWFYKAGTYQTLFAKDSEWQRFLVKYFGIDRHNEKPRTR
jgi:hypothetical protein